MQSSQKFHAFAQEFVGDLNRPAFLASLGMAYVHRCMKLEPDRFSFRNPIILAVASVFLAAKAHYELRLSEVTLNDAVSFLLKCDYRTSHRS